MKVSELIALLQQQDGDADVHYAYGAGDYWRTQLCPTVSRVYEGSVAQSDYHRMDKLIEDDIDDAEIRTVVVID
jgi:hypothetical protein